jgi:hypothetical protein
MINAIIGFHQADERRVIVCSNNQAIKGAHAAPFALLSEPRSAKAAIDQEGGVWHVADCAQCSSFPS